MRVMKTQLGNVKGFVLGIGQKAKVRKGMLSVVAVFFILQMYFVRELARSGIAFGLVRGGADARRDFLCSGHALARRAWMWAKRACA